MIKLQIIGNVGRNAEIKEVNGRKAISFTLASNKIYTDKEGVKQSKITWVSCTAWKEASQSTEVAKYITKGSKIFVEGYPEINMYKDKDGKMNASLNLQVDQIELITTVEAETE
jgi:single-strand DNA-binding protein